MAKLNRVEQKMVDSWNLDGQKTVILEFKNATQVLMRSNEEMSLEMHEFK